MNPTEHELQTLLHTSTSDLTPEVETLVAGGIARGRRQLRLRRAGSALAAVAAIGVIGSAASAVPGVIDRGDSAPAVATASDSVKPSEEPERTAPEQVVDAELAVPASEIPAEITSILARDLPEALENLGRILQDDSYPLVDTERHKVVHFRWDGTLTTFSIEPASTMASCAEQAAETGRCRMVDGLEVLTWPATTADQVTAQGVAVWQQGYIVSAISYNAPEGKDVPPVMDAPAISLEKLTEIAISDVWFE